MICTTMLRRCGSEGGTQPTKIITTTKAAAFLCILLQT